MSLFILLLDRYFYLDNHVHGTQNIYSSYDLLYTVKIILAQYRSITMFMRRFS